ncbi:MAG: flavodoxin family protein [Porcipelethomonas sp.]
MIAIKTLIINGSPRKNGDTAFLIRKLTEQLYGEHKIINAYTANIAPCTDCRKCREKYGCIADDEMQEIYEYLETCDNVVIASPIYFSELTGKLLDLGSRLQMYFSARQFLDRTPKLKRKKGAVLLTGGGSGNPQKAYETAVYLLHYMNVKQIFPLICSHNTDRIPAENDSIILPQISKAAEFLSGPPR